jgi:glycosyltransferase involved in cell wall biosynthesis
MPKKVLMVTGPVHTVPPLKGAAVETWMYEVSKRLAGYESHIVSIANPFYPDREYRDGIYFHRIHISRLYKRFFQKLTRLDPLSYSKRIARIIDKVQPDIIHMHNFMKWAAPLVKLVNKNDVKTVLHMQNEVSQIPELKIDLFIGCSNYIVDSYKNTSIKAKHFSCVYNGVDLNRFIPNWEVKSARDSVREKFGIRKDEFIVLYVGRVSPEKGVEHFIESALMLKDRKRVRFFIIGEIPQGRANNKRVIYGKRMFEMAVPLKDKIIFTDVFPPSKIHLLYLLGDIEVIPSNFNEPFGMVGIEAMASGLPVVAREKGGLKEYLMDGLNGFFIDEGNVSEDIVKKIDIMVSDEDMRKKIGMKGRKTVENKFSWEKITDEVEQQYGILTG